MELEERRLDREQTPFGALELWTVRTPGGEVGYEIRIGGAFLMGSHGSHSERAMAELARGRLPSAARGLAALVGGLGAGHTLRAVLDQPGVERVVVAEIGTAVVRWNRRWFAPFNGGAVDDPRVKVVISDVLEVLRASPGAFHMILLDVDNGPGWLASPRNARLYSPKGLSLCRDALTSSGVAAIWSPGRNRELEDRLDGLGGCRWEAADTLRRARREGEPPATIYLITRHGGFPDGPP